MINGVKEKKRLYFTTIDQSSKDVTHKDNCVPGF